MNASFKPGQLVLMQHATYFSEYDGCPAVVLTPLVCDWALNLLTMEHEMLNHYQVQLLARSNPLLGNSMIVLALPYQLRRPGDEQEQARAEAATVKYQPQLSRE